MSKINKNNFREMKPKKSLVLLYLIVMYPQDVSLTFLNAKCARCHDKTKANLPPAESVTLPSYWRLIIIVLREILWLMTQRPETLWC